MPLRIVHRADSATESAICAILSGKHKFAAPNQCIVPRIRNRRFFEDGLSRSRHLKPTKSTGTANTESSNNYEPRTVDNRFSFNCPSLVFNNERSKFCSFYCKNHRVLYTYRGFSKYSSDLDFFFSVHIPCSSFCWIPW